MEGQTFGKEKDIEEQAKNYPEPNYSDPLYTLSLIEKELFYLNNLVKALKQELKERIR